MKYVCFNLILILACAGTASAELDRPAPSLLIADKKVPEIKSSGNLAVPRVNSNSVVVKSVNDVTPGNTTFKDHQFDKRKLLRCWQYGQLIVAENGYQSPGPSGQVMLTKGAERMTGFDFGDTFCLYLGG